MRYEDIDWNRLWQEARQKKAWKKKGRKDWDRKAAGFARRNSGSPFISHLLELLQPQPRWSVLDVGSGPGTLALPLSERVRWVTALDFSEAMLEELHKGAVSRGITNIESHLLSWTDDWHKAGIKRHDVTISSRSLSVSDLRSGLEKLNNWAGEKAVVVDRVGSGPFDPDLFRAVGREFEPGPDYIVTVNLLYQMGITARVDFIEFDQVKRFSRFQEAVDSCKWMLGPVTGREEEKLNAYIEDRLSRDQDGSLLLHRNRPVKWAFISWDTVRRL